MKMADYELEQGKTRTQPLLLKTITKKSGTCLKMTIAEYYTPNGRSINGKGVEPDVEVEYEYDENNPEADTQLEKALEVVKDQNK